MKLASPIIKKIEDNKNSLRKFELEINTNKDKNLKKILNDYPTVYIHTWKNQDNYEVYVGESNNIFERTREHYRDSKIKENWQYHLRSNDANLYIIGHEHFNKSLTLDIENRLIHYLTGVENIKKVHNSRGNPQNQYFPADEFNEIFNKIWKNLRKNDNTIFPLESSIMDSAIFKASPLHKLTTGQQNAKEWIISKIVEALLNNKRGQLIFVEGEAGTGKTVLNSSTFYELCCLNEFSMEENSKMLSRDLKCCLLINHKEQETVYRQVFKKLCIENKTELVYSPTRFINKYTNEAPVDVAFVDEAHLLLTQGKQSYQGENQLKDILNKSKVTVIMFDPNQILTTEQYWEHELLEKYRKIAKNNNSYIQLTEQLRIKANNYVIKWIDDFTKKGIINSIPKDLGTYDIKVFDAPKLLEREIKEKSKQEESKLSRIVATYDWDYNKQKSNNGKDWEVVINDWHKPWNYQLEKRMNRVEKKAIKDISWAEQNHTIEEIGSTFTIQGFDLTYVGVIIGPSVGYENGKIVFYANKSCNDKATRNRTLSDGTHKKFGDQLLKNELRILMTRGVNGLYIYACDENLRKHLKECAGVHYISN